MTLPNFIIIGAMKAGTTVLYQYLKQHPQIYMSPVKETNFFIRDGKEIEEYHDFFVGASDRIAIGEASPCYLDHSKAYKRIAHYLPEVKLIVIFRNPADRAYSHFFMKYRQDLPGMKEKEILNHFTRMVREDPMITRRGFYGKHIQSYLESFNSEQIFMCLYEDLKDNPELLLQNIYRFLNVDPNYQVANPNTYYNKGGIAKNQKLYDYLDKLKEYFNATVKNSIPEGVNKKIHQAYNNIRNSNLVKPPRLDRETRQQLIAIYQEDILALQTAIDRDLTAWLK